MCPQSSGPTDNVADEAVNEEMNDSLERAATTATGLDVEQDMGNINKTQSKATPNEPSSLGTSSGGGPKRQETMGDTIAQTRILDLENTKTAQAQEITSLKLRVKKLGKKGGSRTHKLKRLYKVGRSARMVSFDDAKQVVAAKDVNLSVDEVTLAQALAALKSAKVQEKGDVIKRRPSANVQDKGKGKMVEPEKPMKKKELIRLDEEIAITKYNQAEFDEAVEGSSKRAREELEQENAKKQKVDDDKETTELKNLIEVMPDEEEVALDAIPLAVKSQAFFLNFSQNSSRINEVFGKHPPGDYEALNERKLDDFEEEYQYYGRM
ncbi:hypothetical protein Tco_0749530 [Tanacetum coccineum]|uniref:Uncharacterized protein n=1 Tax=Tanacetum coccineum TaxID=301880 RepID=A0ABQ4YYP2_9ASTR